MWFVYAAICLVSWGCADLFYKKSSDESDKYSHLRIAVWVGLVMGIVSLALIPFAESGKEVLSFKNLASYSPASLCYIISMVIGYAGLRYMEVSIISPVQNASGAFAAIIMAIYFMLSSDDPIGAIEDETGFTFGTQGGEALAKNILIVFGVAAVCVGVVALALVEQKLSDDEKNVTGADRKYRLGALALLFPILYCIFDTLGTAADGLILDSESGLGLGEIDVAILYGMTFFAAGLICWLWLLIKEKRPYNPLRDIKTMGVAAVFEEAGQIFYIYAMAARPLFAAPMIASYCIVSVILSRIFLKEKLKRSQYACVFMVIAGIVALGLCE